MPNGQRTNENAIASLVLSIIGILICGLCAPIALFLGIKARKEIFLSEGRETGDGMATAGIWISSIAMSIMVIVVLFFMAASIMGS